MIIIAESKRDFDLSIFHHGEVKMAALLPGVIIQYAQPQKNSIWLCAPTPAWTPMLRYRAVIYD